MKLIVFSGLPGTGKSTLAEATGKALKMPVFAHDWLKGALKLSLSNFDPVCAAKAVRELLLTLIKRQFQLNQSAIVDHLCSPKFIHELEEFAIQNGVQFYVIETICSDINLHRCRIEQRCRDIPGWHEISWENVERITLNYQTWKKPHLVVDAVESLEENIHLIFEYIQSETGRSC